MGLPINDLVSLLGKVIHVELKPGFVESWRMCFFKVKAIKRNDRDEIIISGTDDEGLNIDIPIKWVLEYELIH